MTALVAAKGEHEIIWASDSLSILNDRKYLDGAKYVQVTHHRSGNNIVVGCAGDSRLFDAVRWMNWQQVRKSHKEWGERYWQIELLPLILRAAGSSAELEDAYLLISIGEHILVYDNKFICEIHADAYALGTGADYILGHLYSAYELPIEINAVQRSVESAIHYDTFCGGDVHTLEVPY